MSALFRQLPGVDTLLQHPDLRQLPPDAVRRASREVLDGLRREIREGLEELPDIPSRVREQVEALSAMRLKRVINATGIVLHTNLGRAPFAPEAAEAVADVARGYSNTEMNLTDGKRGGRLDGVREPLRQLTGCEDALAVNNNAGAVMLPLFKQYDEDGTGQITRHEFREVVNHVNIFMNEAEFDKFFTAIDTNRDDRISWRDFERSLGV